jgi:hypothetical protein
MNGDRSTSRLPRSHSRADDPRRGANADRTRSTRGHQHGVPAVLCARDRWRDYETRKDEYTGCYALHECLP